MKPKRYMKFLKYISRMCTSQDESDTRTSAPPKERSRAPYGNHGVSLEKETWIESAVSVVT